LFVGWDLNSLWGILKFTVRVSGDAIRGDPDFVAGRTNHNGRT
jgi:hypothetical protein